MMKLDFVFEGGLGNQIFQFLASKYILKNLKNIEINYSLSESIKNGPRNYELNNLLVNPLKTKFSKKNLSEKIVSKILYKFPLLKEEMKSKLIYQLNLLDSLYIEENQLRSSYDPIFKLNRDLNTLINKKKQLKICGYWQNPGCYISDIDSYMTFLVNTKKFIPKEIEPNKYITIHIRRGDYYLNKESIKTYLSRFSPIKFFLLSIQLLPQEYGNMPIILLSDDIKWKKKVLEILINSTNKKITILNTKNKFEDWAILRHASLNICSNSTFSYSAALLNNENKDRKLRCIVPQWINNYQTAYEKGWLKPEGFIEI